MLKIAVFGFFQPDTTQPTAGYRSPVNGNDFMRTVWAMEPPASRVGTLDADTAPCFVKLTALGTSQPVYVQMISETMASGAGLLNCDGYILILDAVKVLAPQAMRNALKRLYAAHPESDVIIAAGRQNEPDALSSEEIREILGLNPALPVYPYVPDAPKTVHRLIRRIAHYIDNPERVAPPVFAGDPPRAPSAPQTVAISSDMDAASPDEERPRHRIHGLDHVAITVSDLDRALDFYRGVLGFRVMGHLETHDERGSMATYLDTGHGRLELFSFSKAGAGPDDSARTNRHVGMQHFALRVTGMEAIVEQLRCAGVHFTMEPRVSPLSGIRLAFFQDPDGTLIELVEGDLTFTRQ